MSYLHTKFHDNWISSFREVAMTRFWDGRTDGQRDRQTDGQTDGVTALLDLLSPSATQVKSHIKYHLNEDVFDERFMNSIVHIYMYLVENNSEP